MATPLALMCCLKPWASTLQERKEDEMNSDNDHGPDSSLSVHQSAPLFAGRLTRNRLERLPGHFFLLSNIADPFNSALEFEVQEATPRRVVWNLIVERGLNDRNFCAFRDREDLEAEKLARWRGVLQQFGICGLMRLFTQMKPARQSAPTAQCIRINHPARSIG